MRFSRHASTAEAVELEETAPPRERRSPMSHNVARRVQFDTAVAQSTYGMTVSQWTCRALARDAKKANSYQSTTKECLSGTSRSLRGGSDR